MSSKKKINIGESIVPYSPQAYYSPFGSVTYGGSTNVNASPEVQQQYTTRQRLINELLPEFSMTQPMQNERINRLSDLMNERIMRYAEPQMYGSFAARGMGDSTLANNALNDLRMKAAESAIFGGEDLYNQQLQRQLQAGQFLQGGLNDIYQWLTGMGQESRANNQQMFDLQNANAQRLLQGNAANAQMAQSRMGDIGKLAGTAMMMIPGMQVPGAALSGMSSFGSGSSGNFDLSSLMGLFNQAPASYGNTGNLMSDMRNQGLRSKYFTPAWYDSAY